MKIGATFATLHISRKIPVAKDLFINFASDKETVFLVSYRRIVGIVFGPVLLLPVKVMMISFTSLAVVGWIKNVGLGFLNNLKSVF